MKPRSQFLVTTLFMLYAVIFLIVSLELTESRFLVKTLPGFHGDLPFTLETGYIGVGESEDVQLFYYFIESEGNPKEDPIMLWLAGGPGCSGLSSLIYQIGPLTINYTNSTMEKAILEINPYSWTKAASIIFLDQPAGSGFAYAKTSNAYITNDTSSTIHTHNFLTKWLMDHPKFINSPLYVGGDSYIGIVVPMVVQEIYNGNEAGEGTYINIKGYVLGNPFTDTNADYNSRIPYAHNMALLSNAIYKSVDEYCRGEYLNVDPLNHLCLYHLDVVVKVHDLVFNLNYPVSISSSESVFTLMVSVFYLYCLARIHVFQISEPYCDITNTLASDIIRRDLGALDANPVDISSLPQVQTQWCRDDNYLYSSVWANSKDVREAIHIRAEFGDTEWVRCNKSLHFNIHQEAISYTHNVMSAVGYHRNLSDKNCRALIYSGDHDMAVPYLSTLNWIESLNLPVIDNWRPWVVNEQVAGYTTKYSKSDYELTFATIKGGGHTGAEYKPKECLSMFMRWLDNESL